MRLGPLPSAFISSRSRVRSRSVSTSNHVGSICARSPSSFTVMFRRTLGVVEALGAVGLILPPLTHVWPWLVPWPAMGLVILMLSAIVFHIRRHENPNIVLNVVLLVLAAVVAYGRFVIAPL